MKERFGYLRASSIHDAVTLLNEPGIRSRPLSGGTDMVLLMREGPPICDRVIDISLIPELHSISRHDNQVVIGAAATFSEVLESPLVQETAPVLVQACQQVGAVQIRNMGTLGGNVANAAACADSLPALVCLDTSATVVTPEDVKHIAVTDLVLGPNRTVIPPGGLITFLSYTIPSDHSRSVFIKLGRRNAMAISRLTVAALGRQDETGRIVEARLVPGAATPRNRRFNAAENCLVGQFPGEDLYRQAAELAIEEMAQLAGRRWSSEFKEPVLTTMILRALKNIFVLSDEMVTRPI
jgi:CO/xanthine dehydrogenase FAD-binding subunit